MRITSFAGPSLAALSCLVAAAQVSASIVTVSDSAPAVGDGVQNLSFSNDDASNTQVQFSSNYVAGDNAALGQTFTTGSDPAGYLLDTIAVRQVSWGTTFWDYTGGNVTLQVFQLGAETPAGSGVWTIVPLATETANVPGEDDGIGFSSGTPTT